VLYEMLTGESPRSAVSLADLGAEDVFHPPDVARRVPAAPVELVEAVTECLAVRPEDRPQSAAALARRLAPIAEAQTLPLPADPEQRATEILAPTLVRPPLASRARRRPVRTLVVAAALVGAAALGLVVALVVAGGGHARHPSSGSTPGAVAPPPTGANAVQEAQDLASWLRQHSR